MKGLMDENVTFKTEGHVTSWTPKRALRSLITAVLTVAERSNTGEAVGVRHTGRRYLI